MAQKQFLSEGWEQLLRGHADKSSEGTITIPAGGTYDLPVSLEVAGSVVVWVKTDGNQTGTLNVNLYANMWGEMTDIGDITSSITLQAGKQNFRTGKEIFVMLFDPTRFPMFIRFTNPGASDIVLEAVHTQNLP